MTQSREVWLLGTNSAQAYLRSNEPPGATQSRFKIALIYFFGALEGLAFGYDTGVVAGALLFIKKEMALSPAAQGLVVSSLLLGSIIAAPITGYVSDKLGARRLIACAGTLFLVGSLGAALAPDPAILIAFRFLLGVGVGIGKVQVPIYLSELAPARSRGRLTSLYQLMTATGIFLAYIVGYFFAGSGNWRMMFGVAMVPAALLILGVFLLPNSPRWLARHGRLTEARETLLRTRSREEADREFADIQKFVPRSALSLRDLVRDPWLKRVLLIALAMAIFQQALGINTIVYYTPTILQKAGFTASAAILTWVCLQALSIVMTFILGRIVDSAGRRIMLMAGAIVMAASMAALGTIFQLGIVSSGAGAGSAIACLAIFKAAFSVSWGPLLWVVMPELLPVRARGAAMGACVFTTYCGNFIISSVFPILLASGPAGAFGTFAGCAVLACLVIFLWLPETARRTLEEIEAAGRRQFA
jgi:sugar porter (SP) family MFS transporter